MHKWVSGCLMVFVLLAGFRPATPPPFASISVQDAPQPFGAVLHYNVYTFNVSAAGSGPIRELTIRAFRGSLLLTRFQLPTDGAVVGADVADLDGNHFPELYVYTRSDGSGSFGRVYGWQFLSEQKADIGLTDWLKMPVGYMGHDSLWIMQSRLYRRFPLYQPGDANAQPSGGLATLAYALRSAGTGFMLISDK